eukprot:UN06122
MTDLNEGVEDMENASVIGLHQELAKLCYEQRKYKQTTDHYLIVLKALTKEFGFAADELLIPCRHMCDCYIELGQYKLAEHFYNELKNSRR